MEKRNFADVVMMTGPQFVEFQNELFVSMNDIVKAKNHDYTGDSGSAFANFTMVEDAGICTTEQGFLTRMMDKMMRITTFVQKGTLKVKDESVQDTLKDLANYATLFIGFNYCMNGSFGTETKKK